MDRSNQNRNINESNKTKQVHSKEKHWRSFVRLILWRVIAFLITLFTAFILTGSIVKAFEIGTIDIVIKFIAQYFYERIWNRVKCGRTSTPVAPTVQIVDEEAFTQENKSPPLDQ